MSDNSNKEYNNFIDYFLSKWFIWSILVIIICLITFLIGLSSEKDGSLTYSFIGIIFIVVCYLLIVGHYWNIVSDNQKIKQKKSKNNKKQTQKQKEKHH